MNFFPVLFSRLISFLLYLIDFVYKYINKQVTVTLPMYPLWSDMNIRGCIQKFPDWVDNEINNNNKPLLRSNTKGYGGKTH
jgi:hypothetical protein